MPAAGEAGGAPYPSSTARYFAAGLKGGELWPEEDIDAAMQGIMPTEARPGLPALDAALPSLTRSEEHTSELQSRGHLVCRLLLEKKKQEWRHLTAPHVARG